ncbi:hypothetical protein AB3S75_007869 [Citrus x aurantiifolia]
MMREATFVIALTWFLAAASTIICANASMPQQLINVEHLTILFTPKVVAAAGLSGNLKSTAARSVAVMDVAHRHEASMACEITIAFASSGQRSLDTVNKIISNNNIFSRKSGKRNNRIMAV